MITIVTPYGALETSNATITVEEQAPLLDPETFNVSLTYPFALPYTPGNAAVLQQLMRFTTHRGEGFTVEATAYMNGLKFASGRLTVNSGTYELNRRAGSINCTLSYEDAVFATAAQSKRVNELKLDGIREIDGDELTTDNPFSGTRIVPAANFRQTTTACSAFVHDDDPYICFPTMYAPNFHGSSNVIFEWYASPFGNDQPGLKHGYIVNHWDPAFFDGFYPMHFNGKPMSSGDQHYYVPKLVPCYYFHQVLKHCFSELGYALTGDLVNDDWFKKKCILNNYSISRHQIVHYTDELGDETWAVSQLPTTIDPANHLPSMTIKEFLTELMTRYALEFSFSGKTVTLRRNQLQKVQGDLSGDILQLYDYEPRTEVGVHLDNNASDDDPMTGYLSDASVYKLDGYRNGDTRAQIAAANPYSGTPELWLTEEDNWFYRRTGTNSFKKIVYNAVRFTKGSKPKRLDHAMIPASSQTVPTNYDGNYPADIPAVGFQGCYFVAAQEAAVDASSVSTYDAPIEIQTINPGVFYLAFYHGLWQTNEDSVAVLYAAASTFKKSDYGLGPVRVGWYHLGWYGRRGLIEVFWPGMLEVYCAPATATLRLPPDPKFLYNHKWGQRWLCRGAHLYVTSRNYDAPLRRQDGMIYKTYVLQ